MTLPFTRDRYLYYFVVLTFIALAFGFLWSRVLYSVGLLFMGLYIVSRYSHLVDLSKDKYFMISLLIPLCNLVRDGFGHIYFINLSLPLFIAFFQTLKTKKEWVKDGFLWSIMIFLLTAFHSTYLYYSDIDKTTALYKIAQVVNIGMFNDHIRFSIVMVSSIFIMLYFLSESLLNKWQAFFGKVYITFTVFFIHMLAARTGLILFYFSSILYLLYFVVRKKRYIHIGFLAILPLLFYLSYKAFPSIYHRVGYSFYDYDYYKNMNYREGSSDGIRYYSLICGKDIFISNVWKGVGFYKLRESSNEWYSTRFPNMKIDEMMLPHNQFLVYGAAAGMMGILVLILFYFYPLYKRKSLSIEAKIILSSLCVISLLDVFLDSQIKIYGLGFFSGLCFYILKKTETELKNS